MLDLLQPIFDRWHLVLLAVVLVTLLGNPGSEPRRRPRRRCCAFRRSSRARTSSPRCVASRRPRRIAFCATCAATSGRCSIGPRAASVARSSGCSRPRHARRAGRSGRSPTRSSVSSSPLVDQAATHAENGSERLASQARSAVVGAARQVRSLGGLARDRWLPVLRRTDALPVRRRRAVDREPREGDRRTRRVPAGLVPRGHARLRDRVVRRRAHARPRVLRPHRHDASRSLGRSRRASTARHDLDRRGARRLVPAARPVPRALARVGDRAQLHRRPTSPKSCSASR